VDQRAGWREVPLHAMLAGRALLDAQEALESGRAAVIVAGVGDSVH